MNHGPSPNKSRADTDIEFPQKGYTKSYRMALENPESKPCHRAFAGVRVVLEACPFQQHCREVAVVLGIGHYALREQLACFLDPARCLFVSHCPVDFLDQVREVWLDRDVMFVWPDPVIKIFLERR